LSSNKSRHCRAGARAKIATFSAREFLMETSQISQSIADLVERTDALRGYL
jgi:hypothetical protein